MSAKVGSASSCRVGTSDVLAHKGRTMWWERQEHEQQRRELQRVREQGAVVAATTQDFANYSRTQRTTGLPHGDRMNNKEHVSQPPESKIPGVAAREVHPQESPTIAIPALQSQQDNQSSNSARTTTPEGTGLLRAPSLTKNMISPIVKGTPQSSSSRKDAWLDPRPASQGFEHDDRIVAQRDAKIVLLQKQVDVLKAALREKGLTDCETTLSSLFSTDGSEVTRLQLDLDQAHRQLKEGRISLEDLQKKQRQDIQDLRNMYEQVVHTSATHEEEAARLRQVVRNKEEMLLTWQRSHGELEEELDRTIVNASQLRGARDSEQEERDKEAESLHKRLLECTKQNDTVRKDRDKRIAELHELKAVMAGHEGVLKTMKEALREAEYSHERILGELEKAQAEANSLRQEVVALQNDAMSQQVRLCLHTCITTLLCASSALDNGGLGRWT